MSITFNEKWHLTTSANIRIWQNSNRPMFVDIAKYDAERIFCSVFGVDDKHIFLDKKKGYEYVKVTLDALKQQLVDPHIAYILIRFVDVSFINSWGPMDEKKIGKRRYELLSELENRYQVTFESTQAMALARAFQVPDLENDPENYIESEVFKLLVDNYDLVRRITKEYEGISTYKEYSERS